MRPRGEEGPSTEEARGGSHRAPGGLSPASSPRAPRGWWGWATVGIWLAFTLPWILGWETLIVRDVFTTHLPYKAFGAAELAEGRIPAVNPTWALGQPYRGNPNALPFYPGNVFYHLLPFWSAFSLHYALHWLLAGVAMGVLARILGQRREGALVAALAYGGGGFVVTALSFYNILAVAAWAPLAAAGAAAAGRLGLCAGGLAWAMALLGGEPITAALCAVPVLAAAVARHGMLAGAGRALGVGLLGLGVSAPQWVAFLRALPFTTRGGVGLGGVEAGHYSLETPRLLELLVPFPLGIPGRFDAWGFWAGAGSPVAPYVMSFFAGCLALPLACGAWRQHRGWAALALAGLLLALAGGWSGIGGAELLAATSFGLFRYSEKLLLWTAWALALLAGWGVERLRQRARPGGSGAWSVHLRRAAGVVGVLAVAASVVAWWRPAWAVVRVEGWLAPGFPPGTASALLWRWGGGLGLAALVWHQASRAAHLGRTDLLAGLYLVSLLPLLLLVRTDSTGLFRGPPPFVGELEGRRAVWNPSLASLSYGFRPMSHHLLPDVVERNRYLALDLDPAP
ncbi:MAG: hypothetical protein MI919_27600, partial [Holophagales bacterium]|nr:hypothetical protein [Holophagales bacterium]